MIHELAGIVGALVHRILAAHLDVATERDRVDSIVGVAFAEADQPLAESDGELLPPPPPAQPLGHGIVAELVDQDHETQYGNHRYQRGQEIRHNRDARSPNSLDSKTTRK